ncbi:MAG: dihydropteroate synthase [Methylococcales bacterium]
MALQKLLESKKPIIMGILNLTPDSFSDGGSHTDRGRAVQHALRMIDEGADIIDVGGESTRPGAKRISANEQIRRVVDTIEALRRTLPADVPISVDTTLEEVASEAVAAGASLINDVRAGRDDAGLFKLAAEKDLPIVLMHMLGSPETMQENPSYGDALDEVKSFLLSRAEEAENAGIKKGNIIIDPGIGFGKTKEHNLQLIAGLDAIVDTGYPVLLGTSRKRFMGSVCNEKDPKDLLGATCATTSIGVFSGIRIFRVHDVKPNRQAADVSWAIRREKLGLSK